MHTQRRGALLLTAALAAALYAPSIGLAQVSPSAYTLELLHAADQEAAAAAVVDAPNFSGVLNALKDQDLGGERRVRQHAGPVLG